MAVGASKNNRLNMVSALDHDRGDIVAGRAALTNFLLVGMDLRYGRTRIAPATPGRRRRSDTVMLVNTGQPRAGRRGVDPRDLAIADQCGRGTRDRPNTDPSTTKAGTLDPRLVCTTETKLNSTLSSFGGPKCPSESHSEHCRASINRFIAIDFVGFAQDGQEALGAGYASAMPGLRTGHGGHAGRRC